MSGFKYTLRSATNEDLGEITSLVVRILPEFDFSFSPDASESDLLDIEDTYLKRGGAFEVLENDKSEIIGTVALLRVNEKTARLRKMYVDQAYRKLGLGRALMDRILNKAEELQIEEIILETVESMRAAIKLYEKYGFERVEADTIMSARCDTVMKKKLTSSQ